MIRNPDEVAPVLKQAMGLQGPVIVGVYVDCGDNPKLFKNVDQNSVQQDKYSIAGMLMLKATLQF